MIGGGASWVGTEALQRSRKTTFPMTYVATFAAVLPQFVATAPRWLSVRECCCHAPLSVWCQGPKWSNGQQRGHHQIWLPARRRRRRSTDWAATAGGMWHEACGMRRQVCLASRNISRGIAIARCHNKPIKAATRQGAVPIKWLLLGTENKLPPCPLPPTKSCNIVALITKIKSSAAAQVAAQQNNNNRWLRRRQNTL